MLDTIVRCSFCFGFMTIAFRYRINSNLTNRKLFIHLIPNHYEQNRKNQRER